jgi:hypothetical protein
VFGITAQNNPNYKVLIKDASGNILSSKTVDIRLTIIAEKGSTIIYQETHSGATTDINGLVSINIGEGIPNLNRFSDVAWESDVHFLKAEVDLEQDDTFINLGTSKIMGAEGEKDTLNPNSSESRSMNGAESIAMGYDPLASGLRSTSMGSSTRAEGEYSTAMGRQTRALGHESTSMGFGTVASGISSTAMGSGTTASGAGSTSMGNSTNASGELSTAMGQFTEASGGYSTAMGYFTTAFSFAETAVGQFNTSYTPENIGGSNFFPNDRLFVMGNGVLDNPSDALIVLKNGTITAPSFDIAEITNDKALITKEYAEANFTTNGLEKINEGNGDGWRLIGGNPSNYGNIGGHSVDFSLSDVSSQTYGATGDYSIATGFLNKASGAYSTAMGRETIAAGGQAVSTGFRSRALGNQSTALGYITTAQGSYSTAMGYNTTANSSNSTAMGRYNVGGGSTTSWVSSDPLFEIGNGSSNAIRSNALTVLKNGNIGIGTSNPEELLHVDGIVRIGTEFIEDTGFNLLSFDASLVPAADNFMSLGTSDFRWSTVFSTNGTINTSDRREKKNIKDLNYGLAEVLEMQPVSFNWKDKNNPDLKLGLIAQDLQALIPEVVISHTLETNETTGQITKKEVDRLGVYYSDLVPVLINAIQEQQEIINIQNTKIKTIEMKLDALLEANKQESNSSSISVN